VGIPVYVYIPKFYTDVMGVNIAFMGAVLLAVRFFDAFTDPMIGFISDRTSTFMGRRRPYILFGSVFLCLSLFFLFNPGTVNQSDNTLWFGIWVFLLFLSWTIVTVPYEALGPEITFDYRERNTLFAMRDGALILGTLVAAASPLLIKNIFKLPDTPGGETSKFFLFSVFYIPLIIICTLLCFFYVKETYTAESLTEKGKLNDIKAIFRNRPFIILLAAYTISAIGNNLPATLILYYVEYVLHSQYADLFLFLYFFTGITFLPMWIKIANRFGKKEAWTTAMLLNTGSFLGVFFLGPGDDIFYGILVFLSGIGFGATLAVPSSIQADVIDYGELMTGKRLEGQYIGIWSIAKKIAAASGVGVSLTVLGTAGYEPNMKQSEEVVLTLRTLYALVPCIFNFIAVVIVLKYPINEKFYNEMRRKIDQKLVFTGKDK